VAGGEGGDGEVARLERGGGGGGRENLSPRARLIAEHETMRKEMLSQVCVRERVCVCVFIRLSVCVCGM